MAWTADTLKSENLNFIRTLPYYFQIRIDGLKIAVIHADLNYTDEWYPSNRPDLFEELSRKLDSDLLIVGHTHEALDLTLKGGGRVINPGAVGRALDGDVRACSALLDTRSGECLFYKTDYPIYDATSAVLQAGLPPGIAAMMLYGNPRVDPEQIQNLEREVPKQ